MNVDWAHMLWQGRWEGLVLVWNAIWTDVHTLWWFGPLLIVLVIAAGRKGILRLGAYVAKVFLHTHWRS